jgi:hypothetical protein
MLQSHPSVKKPFVIGLWTYLQQKVGILRKSWMSAAMIKCQISMPREISCLTHKGGRLRITTILTSRQRQRREEIFSFACRYCSFLVLSIFNACGSWQPNHQTLFDSEVELADRILHTLLAKTFPGTDRSELRLVPICREFRRGESGARAGGARALPIRE